MKKNKDEGHSSSSEDDEKAELLTEDIEKTFFNVISRLKKKDPKLYDESESFFSLHGSRINESTKSNQSKSSAKLKSNKCNTGESSTDEFWTSSNISEEDKFLRDYILNKKFLEHDEHFDLKKELEKLTEEEKEVEEQTIFEEKYNCRFENFDEDFLRKYPRTFKRAQKEKLENNPNKEINVSEMDKSGETSSKRKIKKSLSSETTKDNESSIKKMKKDNLSKIQPKEKNRKEMQNNDSKICKSKKNLKSTNKRKINKFGITLEKKPRKLRHRALFRKSAIMEGKIQT